jgi:hypothetical protein
MATLFRCFPAWRRLPLSRISLPGEPGRDRGGPGVAKEGTPAGLAVFGGGKGKHMRA